MAHVELKQVQKSYDGHNTVVHSVDLEIRHGEFAVSVGPSGCGKSTLLRMVAGLETVTAGDILIDGQRVNDLPPRQRDIAMVFQDYALYPHKNLFENMAFGLRLRKEPESIIRQRVMEAAELLRIDHLLDRRPGALSGGQRQRVAIGRAIVRQPKVFLFDEPLSNLDAQLRGEMRAEIKKLHQRLGATIIYVTHDQVEAMTLADRIAVMQGGHKIQYDTPHAIYNHPCAVFVAGFTGSPPMNLLKAECTPSGVKIADQTLTLPAHQLARLAGCQQVVVGIRPENLQLQTIATDGIALHVSLSLLEPLGAETLGLFQIGSQELTARLSARFQQPAGSLLTLHTHTDHLHLFDAATGQAL